MALTGIILLPMTDQTIIRERIVKLKKDLNAIILAHNYQRPEVQDIADITGDSLELSRAAARTDVKVIGLGLAYNRGAVATVVHADADIETMS